MDLWQRSVKRKYDYSILDEYQKSHKNNLAKPTDKAFFRCNSMKGSNSDDLEPSIIEVEDNSDAELQQLYRKKDIIPMGAVDISRFRTSKKVVEFNHPTKNIDDDRSASCKKKIALLRNALQEEHRALDSDDLEPSTIEVENNCDVELQWQYKKKDIIPMDAVDVLRNIDDDRSSTCKNEIALLRNALQAEHKALDALSMELEEERNASAVAASEAINMIARLQEEKAVLQMETQHYKMMAEEREAHDEEAIALLKDILMRKEEYIFDLEDEVEAYVQVLRRFELEGWEKEPCRRILSEMLGNDSGIHLLEGKEESADTSNCFDSRARSCWDTSDEVINRRCKRMLDIDQIYQTYSDCFTSGNVRRGFTNKIDAACDENYQPSGAPEKFPIYKTRCDEISEPAVSFSGDISIGMSRNPLKRTFYVTGNTEISKEKKSEDLEFTEEKCAILGTMRVCKEKKSSLGVSFPIYAIEEQEDKHIWDYLSSLEEGIEQLGEQQKRKIEWINQNTPSLHNEAATQKEAFVMGLDDVPNKHWKQLEGRNIEHKSPVTSNINTLQGSLAINGKHLPEKFIMPSSHQHLEPGLVSHNWNKLQNKGLQYAWRNVNTQESFSQELHITESEGSHIEEYGDTGEGVHDAFEVHHAFWRSRSSLSEESFKNDSAARDCAVCPGILCLPEGSIPCKIEEGSFLDDCGMKTITIPIKQSSSDYKFGLSPPQSVTHKCQSSAASGDIDDQASVPGKEVQQLTLRLQTLETERAFMKQAIESLKKENRDLRLLELIAQQLRELEGIADKSEQPKEPLQCEQLSFTSLLKKFPALDRLRGSARPRELKHGISFPVNAASSVPCRDRMGLPSLLKEPSDSAVLACVRRGLNVKLLFGGPHPSHVPSEVPACRQSVAEQ